MISHQFEPQISTDEIAIIRRLLGLSKRSNIHLMGEGTDSRAYSINNDEYIFKFPRTDEAAASYKQEIAVLKLLESTHLSLMTPIVKWEDSHCAYFGYIGVPGSSIKSHIKQLPTLLKEQIGASLGRFLKQLHALKPIGVAHTTLQQEITNYQDNYQQGLGILTPSFTEMELKELEHFFYDDLPSQMTKLGYAPKFCHGDLLLNNILIDSHDQIGVIDFGNAGYYDQAKDFSNLWDDTIRSTALKAYGPNETLSNKIDLRSRALPVSSLSFYINQQDNDGIEKELRNIRKTFFT